MKTTTVVLSAYNLEKIVESSLSNIKNSFDIVSSTTHPFFYIVDDCSSDDTYSIIQQSIKKLYLDAKLIKHNSNLGLPNSELEGYRYALEMNSDWIIKTDLDSDFKYGLIIPSLIGGLNIENLPFIVAQRNISEEELRRFNLYEFFKKSSIYEILAEFRIPGLDPASVGTQSFQSDFLRKLLQIQYIGNYNKFWGLDIAMVLVAKKILNISPEIIQIPGNYEQSRRSPEKIKEQYNLYSKVVNEVLKIT